MKEKILKIIDRNENYRGSNTAHNSVILKYYHESINIGDQLSKIVCEWMLQKQGLSFLSYAKKKRFLCAVGSVLGGVYDATVWGSGILNDKQAKKIKKRSWIVKYDVRCVRGPLTREALLAGKYTVPKKYGDPTILMPLIYCPEKIEKKYDVSIISHIRNPVNTQLHKIDVQTSDYEFFIKEILRSKKIISSSLHGIILAESYGIPAIFINQEMDDEILKFYDYYYSTNRYEVKIAYNLDEALKMKPMVLPKLSNMQEEIINAFPYDLWG